MSSRELVVLGTASQAPTRARSHVAAFLRLDRVGVLLDPGEGTQRQLLHAGVPSSRIDRICVTHAHGDHCLGLAGVLQRMVLDGRRGEVPVHCPASAVDRLRLLADFALAGGGLEVQWQPADEQAPDLLWQDEHWRLESVPLEHRVPAVGYRLVEADRAHLLPERLRAAGVAGPDIARLQREGVLGGTRLEQVSEVRRGQRVAFVMDTRVCEGARELARDTDLLAVEATFLDRDAGLAHDYAHLTAGQAASLAHEAGARRVVLLHFSQRYPDLAEHEREARAEHPDVHVARDLDVVPVPTRR